MIIMLSGYAGTGKDTTADYLVQEFGFLKGAFASWLKSDCSKLYELPLNYFEDRELKEKPLPNLNNLSPRDILIKEGAVKRSIHPDFFVHKLMYQLSPWEHQYVISDFRYVNEYNLFKDFFGSSNVITVRVNRNVKISDSPSEHQLDTFNFDFTLDNNASYEDLYKQIDSLLEKLNES